MYATVFLILVRQRRRARAALTLCAQCRHKYAIYASVWASPPSPRVPGSCTRTRESGGGMHTCAWGGRGCMGFLRYPRDRAPLVLYVVLRFLAPCRHAVLPPAPSPPPRFFSSSPPPSIVFLPPSPLSFSSFSTLPSIHPLLSSGLNCCNLWPMPVDLTVELSHGDLYGLLILQRSSGGWNLAMGFHRFSTGQAQPLGGG